jgi:putative sigma-54 modulation protein
MKVNVQSIGLSPRQDLLDLIDEKIQKLDKISDRIVEAKVILRVDKADDRSNKTVEIRLAIPGNDIFVKKQGESFEEVVQKATDTLQREVKDWKDRSRG